MKPDKRRDHYRADAVKVGRKPLTGGQRQALAILAKQAREFSRSEMQDADFRHSVIFDATEDHDAGQVSCLSEATGAHFKAIKAGFLLMLGKTGEALELLKNDTPDQRRKDLILHLIRKELRRIPSLSEDATAEETEASRWAWANGFCRNVWHCDLEHAEAGQLDFLFRKMKPAIADKAAVRTGAVKAAAKPAPEPEPEQAVRILRRFVPMGAESRHIDMSNVPY